MSKISPILEQVIKKYTGTDLPDIKQGIASDLEFGLLFNIDTTKPFKEAKKEFLRNYLNDLLTISLGNISLAAKKAHVHRRHLHRMLNELDIDPNIQRTVLVKPTHYMKSSIYNILEESFSHLPREDYVRTLYSKIDDISELLADSIETYSYDEALDFFEKEFIKAVLRKHENDIPKAAKELDMSERTLYRKISKFNLL